MSRPHAYSTLHAALDALHRGADASEFHGSLCGALCVQSVDEIDLLKLVDAGAPSRSRAPQVLKQLRDEALVALQDDALGFTPILPDDDVPLAERVDALSHWCAGFLYGLTLRNGFDPERLNEDAREIVADFSDLTRAGLDSDEDDEIEEVAYAELVEYVRVGAQLIYMELRPSPTRDPHDSTQVH